MTEIPDPQQFIDSYGPDADIAFDNGMRMTLGQALEAERVLCQADPSARQEPAKRLGWLAARLAAADSLRPEDAHLLELQER